MGIAGITRGSLKTRTLHIKFPLGKTLALAFVIFLLIVITVETGLKFEPVARHLPNSNLGGSHYQFERQVIRLEKVESTGEPIDCILLGSSLVWLGINPGVFENAYREETGQIIHCFNFGVEAMPATAAVGVAQYLVEDYEPKLLIYGIHARDVGTPIRDHDSQVILKDPWYRYQNGDFTIKGWLAEHSLIFRNTTFLEQLLRLNFEELRVSENALDYQKHGFDPKLSSKWDVDNLPNMEDPGLQNGINFYSQFEVRQENLAALKELSTLSGDVEVIVVAMPVHPNFYKFFGEGEKDYTNYIHQVEDTLSSTNVTFLKTTEFPTPGKKSWWDYSHLTLDGANIFSKWLGRNVGQITQNGI